MFDSVKIDVYRTRPPIGGPWDKDKLSEELDKRIMPWWDHGVNFGFDPASHLAHPKIKDFYEDIIKPSFLEPQFNKKWSECIKESDTRFEITMTFRTSNRLMISMEEYYKINTITGGSYVNEHIQQLKMGIFNKVYDIISDKEQFKDCLDVIIERVDLKEGKPIRIEENSKTSKNLKEMIKYGK